MIKKILPALLLLLLLTPAFATVTVTWSTPADGSIYNNLAANVQAIDMNFAITDDNFAVEDMNLTIIYHAQNALITTGTALVSDLNIFDMNANPTSTRRCDGNAWSNFTCSVVEIIPVSTSMPNGTYFIDVRVADSDKPGDVVLSDINARIGVTIDNTLATGGTTRDLMSVVGLVLAGLVIIMGLISGVLLKTDPTKTAILTVVGAIAVAIGAQVIGVVLIPL